MKTWIALAIAALTLAGCKEPPKTWPCKELFGIICYADGWSRP
jgi:hypothetical protein